MVKESKIQKKQIFILSAVVVLIIIGIFKNQVSALLRIFYGVTIDRAIHLTTPKRESFNIAVLGIGGTTHDGPDLSDTIILANVNVKQGKVNMFSIPRDLWIPSAEDKVNAIYAEEKKRNNGLKAVEDALRNITGQKVDYVLVLDFEGFIKLVDHLDGIDVNVLQALDDYHYPIEGNEEETCGKTNEDITAFTATTSAETELWDYFPCRYKHVYVQAGLIHMNGVQALEFVRSRHGVGSEGSDFARSRRQQQVIAALKEKAFSLGVILNPIKLVGVYNILKSNIDTNINIDKIDDFIKLANKLKEGEVKSYVIDEGNNVNEFGLLVNPPITEEYKLKWVLTPRIGNGDYSEIQEYVSCIVQDNTCIVGRNGILTPRPSPSIGDSRL